MLRTIRSSVALAGLLALPIVLAAGCRTYTERVGCAAGQVLDEHDRCVRPDAGRAVRTCGELCDALPEWSAERRACFEDRLASIAVTLPPSCAGLAEREACLACAADLGAADADCAAAASVCP